MSARLMQHDTDPAEEIRAKVKDHLGDIKLMYNQVLVGVYKRPEKTKSGIILADATRDEDDFQGKVGLVLMKGPTAFLEDPDMGAKFHGQNVEVGDWIAFRTSDASALKLGGQLCRLVSDVHVRMVLAAPDIVW